MLQLITDAWYIEVEILVYLCGAQYILLIFSGYFSIVIAIVTERRIEMSRESKISVVLCRVKLLTIRNQVYPKPIFARLRVVIDS